MTNDEKDAKIQQLEERLSTLEEKLRLSRQPLTKGGRDEKSLRARPFVWDAFNKKTVLESAKKTFKADAKSNIPKALLNVVVTATAVSVNGRTMNELVVKWVQVSDPNYDRAKIWIKGYETNNELALTGKNAVPYRMYTESADSPLTFRLEATGEEIMIAVQAVNQDGVGQKLKDVPTVRFTLPKSGDAPVVEEAGPTLF